MITLVSNLFLATVVLYHLGEVFLFLYLNESNTWHKFGDVSCGEEESLVCNLLRGLWGDFMGKVLSWLLTVVFRLYFYCLILHNIPHISSSCMVLHDYACFMWCWWCLDASILILWCAVLLESYFGLLHNWVLRFF